MKNYLNLFTGRKKGQSWNQRCEANRRRECCDTQVLPHHVPWCLCNLPACRLAAEVIEWHNYYHDHYYLCNPFRVEPFHEGDESAPAGGNGSDSWLRDWLEPRRRCSWVSRLLSDFFYYSNRTVNSLIRHVKDTIILTSGTQLLSLLSNWFWFLLLLGPIRAIYMLWGSVIKPWLGQKSDQDQNPQANDKKQKKMERRMKRVSSR